MDAQELADALDAAGMTVAEAVEVLVFARTIRAGFVAVGITTEEQVGGMLFGAAKQLELAQLDNEGTRLRAEAVAKAEAYEREIQALSSRAKAIREGRG